MQGGICAVLLNYLVSYLQDLCNILYQVTNEILRQKQN
jgi:hypothetical protein